MKRKLPLILLLISLAFNAFFVGGFFWAKAKMKQAHSLEERAWMLAEKLELTEEQSRTFANLLERYQKLRDQKQPRREEFWAEMLKDKPDPQVLEEYMIGLAADEYRLQMLDLIQEFMDSLTSQQREKFVERINNRRSSSK